MVKMSDYSVFSCNRRKCYSRSVAAALTQSLLSPFLFPPLSFSLALSVCTRVVLWLGKDQVHNIIQKSLF
jgi:hypothetical protein